jgi:hypothetical protein
MKTDHLVILLSLIKALSPFTAHSLLSYCRKQGCQPWDRDWLLLSRFQEKFSEDMLTQQKGAHPLSPVFCENMAVVLWQMIVGKGSF